MRVFGLEAEAARRRALLEVSDRPLRLRVGALGELTFEPGYYAYVGSARRGLAPRLRRHLRRKAKKMRWHVDYLRRGAEPVAAAAWTGRRADECALSRSVAALCAGSVPRFGSSDCRCPSHLHYFPRDPRPRLRRLPTPC